MIFSQDWWYKHTGKYILQVLGVYALCIFGPLAILAFPATALALTTTLLIILGTIFVGITKKPWKYGKPTVIAVIVSLIIYGFLPGLVVMVAITALMASVLAGLAYPFFLLARYFKKYLRYRRSTKPTYIVHHVRRR